jgi:hypothetical protein
MTNEPLDPIDSVIDDVANAMTAAPPDARFAMRVSARIAEAGDRPAPWLRLWIVVPMASACALALAVFVFVGRPFQGRQGGDESPAPQATSVERAAQGRHGGAERPAPQTARLPELPPATIEPIEVDRLDIQPLVQIADIPIGAIAIDRIEITAMP